MIWFVMIWLFFHLGFEIYLTRINLVYAFKKEHSVPVILQDIITVERFEKSKNYLRDNTFFSNTKSMIAFFITVFTLIWVLPFLEKWSQIWSTNYFWQGLFFFGGIYMINLVTGLPFSWFENFRIEQKFGFNKMTIQTFWSDVFKNMVTTLVLGALFMIGVLWAVRSPVWWWQFTLLVIVFFLISLWIGPTILMPLFNHFSPMEEGEMKETLQQFALQHKIPMKKIFIMDASKRSNHGNAFFTGIGPTQRLVLYDTLLSYPTEEVLSIIGHEWGHWKHRDIWRQLCMLVVVAIVLFYSANLLYHANWIRSVFHVTSGYAVLYTTMIIISPVLFFVQPMMNHFIRTQEFSADRFSAHLLKSSAPGMQSLKRIISDNLSNLHPHPLYKVWFYSHPAPEERIQALKELS